MPMENKAFRLIQFQNINSIVIHMTSQLNILSLSDKSLKYFTNQNECFAINLMNIK